MAATSGREGGRFEELLDTLKSIDKHIVEGLGKVQRKTEEAAQTGGGPNRAKAITDFVKLAADNKITFKNLGSVLSNLVKAFYFKRAAETQEQTAQQLSYLRNFRGRMATPVDIKRVKEAERAGAAGLAEEPQGKAASSTGNTMTRLGSNLMRSFFARGANGAAGAAGGAAGGGGGGAAAAAGAAGAAGGGLPLTAGSTIVTFGSMLAGLGSVTLGVGVALAALTGVALATVAATSKFADSMLEANRKFADVSGAMAAVMARLEVGNIQHRMRMGNRLAGSADELAQARLRLQEFGEERQVLTQTLMNKLGTLLANIGATFNAALDGMAASLNKIVGNTEPVETPQENKNFGELLQQIAMVPMPGDPRVFGNWAEGPPGRPVPYRENGKVIFR